MLRSIGGKRMKILIDIGTYYINFDHIAEFYIKEIGFNDVDKEVAYIAKKRGANSIYQVAATGSDFETTYIMAYFLTRDTAQFFLKELVKEFSSPEQGDFKVIIPQRLVRKANLEDYYVD